MENIKTINLGKGINLTLIQEEKFKSNLVSIYIQRLLDRDEVANKLGISTRTLQSHISSIYAKTGYDNLAKLSVYCVSNGLIVTNLESPEE